MKKTTMIKSLLVGALSISGMALLAACGSDETSKSPVVPPEEGTKPPVVQTDVTKPVISIAALSGYVHQNAYLTLPDFTVTDDTDGEITNATSFVRDSQGNETFVSAENQIFVREGESYEYIVQATDKAGNFAEASVPISAGVIPDWTFKDESAKRCIRAYGADITMEYGGVVFTATATEITVRLFDDARFSALNAGDRIAVALSTEVRSGAPKIVTLTASGTAEKKLENNGREDCWSIYETTLSSGMGEFTTENEENGKKNFQFKLTNVAVGDVIVLHEVSFDRQVVAKDTLYDFYGEKIDRAATEYGLSMQDAQGGDVTLTLARAWVEGENVEKLSEATYKAGEYVLEFEGKIGEETVKRYVVVNAVWDTVAPVITGKASYTVAAGTSVELTAEAFEVEITDNNTVSGAELVSVSACLIDGTEVETAENKLTVESGKNYRVRFVAMDKSGNTAAYDCYLITDEQNVPSVASNGNAAVKMTGLNAVPLVAGDDVLDFYGAALDGYEVGDTVKATITYVQLPFARKLNLAYDDCGEETTSIVKLSTYGYDLGSVSFNTYVVEKNGEKCVTATLQDWTALGYKGEGFSLTFVDFEVEEFKRSDWNYDVDGKYYYPMWVTGGLGYGCTPPTVIDGALTFEMTGNPISVCFNTDHLTGYEAGDSISLEIRMKLSNPDGVYFCGKAGAESWTQFSALGTADADGYIAIRYTTTVNDYRQAYMYAAKGSGATAYNNVCFSLHKRSGELPTVYIDYIKVIENYSGDWSFGGDACYMVNSDTMRASGAVGYQYTQPTAEKGILSFTAMLNPISIAFNTDKLTGYSAGDEIALEVRLKLDDYTGINFYGKAGGGASAITSLGTVDEEGYITIQYTTEVYDYFQTYMYDVKGSSTTAYNNVFFALHGTSTSLNGKTVYIDYVKVVETYKGDLSFNGSAYYIVTTDTVRATGAAGYQFTQPIAENGILSFTMNTHPISIAFSAESLTGYSAGDTITLEVRLKLDDYTGVNFCGAVGSEKWQAITSLGTVDAEGYITICYTTTVNDYFQNYMYQAKGTGTTAFNNVCFSLHNVSGDTVRIDYVKVVTE